MTKLWMIAAAGFLAAALGAVEPARAGGGVVIQTGPYTRYEASSPDAKAELSFDGVAYDGYAARAYGYVDVPSGKLGLRIAGDRNVWALAQLDELLTFHIDGAAADTVTQVALNLSLDGDPGNIWGVENRNYFYANAGTIHQRNYAFMTNDGWAYGNGSIDAFGCSAAAGAAASNYKATCLIDLVGANPVLGLTQQLKLAVAYAWPETPQSADYSHTASLNIVAPQGVTWTSQSGAYLTAAVPEPSSWAMMIIGFGAAGALLRRRGSGSRGDGHIHRAAGASVLLG